MQSRFNFMNNGSPAETALNAPSPDVGRSAFDYSFIHNGNTLIGLLAPVACFDVFPGEDIDISLAALLEFRNPSTRQLYNGFRVYFHAYYNKLVDLWEGARNWLDNGRSGKIQLTRPNLVFSESATLESTAVIASNACTPMSLLNFLGLAPEAIQDKDGASHTRIPLRHFQATYSDSSNSNYTFNSLANHVDYFPADCALAYQRNWRDFYCNKNLLQNNKYWFPDNEDHFILSYSCSDACALLYEDEMLSSTANPAASRITNLVGDYLTFKNTTQEPNNPRTPSGPVSVVNAPNLSGIKFRQFRGDRFTTASPFPDLLRGDLPILQLTEDNFVRFAYTNPNTGVSSSKIPVNGKQSGTFSSNSGILSGSNDASFGVTGTSTSDARNSLLTPESTVTMSDIYTLETLTAFKRKMGMTNGDYNETIKAQFGVNPNFHDRKGTYIGGFYQDFALSSVVQSSESGTTPLGTKAGQGVSSGSGKIGHFRVNDFGWIQVYMSVVPDVYYTQGKPRMFSKKSNLEMYFPLFNNLPAQCIRNDELYVSSNATINPQPFNYEDRYAEYKSQHNRVSGLMSLSPSVSAYDSSRVMARRFSNVPNFNTTFVSLIPENTDMSVFSVQDEPPFDFSIAFNIRRVSPMPYIAIEGSMSSPRLNA